MSDDSPFSGTGKDPAESALTEIERLAGSEEEDHEKRLGALERLHTELEAELEERSSESRPPQ
jgi:hypothetical protein